MFTQHSSLSANRALYNRQPLENVLDRNHRSENWYGQKSLKMLDHNNDQLNAVRRSRSNENSSLFRRRIWPSRLNLPYTDCLKEGAACRLISPVPTMRGNAAVTKASTACCDSIFQKGPTSLAARSAVGPQPTQRPAAETTQLPNPQRNPQSTLPWRTSPVNLPTDFLQVVIPLK